MSCGVPFTQQALGRKVSRIALLSLLVLASCTVDSNSNTQSKPPGESIVHAAQAAEQNPEDTDDSPRSPVIVVGSGISGLAAALELGRGGAEVTVIDMSSVFGGHAVMSQGSLSIAGSPVQQAAGIQDSPELALQ